METVEVNRTASPTDAYLVGGVASGWNRFRDSGRTLVSRASGSKIWDTEGKEYIDWIMGWGSLILGHNPEPVLTAIKESFDVGFGYQYESPLQGELASAICDAVPCAERVRFANSGTEATLHAVRIARAATGRPRIIKFEGHFHGLNDYLLFGVDCGKELGALDAEGFIQPVPGSAGLPSDALEATVVVVPFNDPDAVERAFKRYEGEIAGIILEPVALNIGCVAPLPGFLARLRELCNDNGSLLIFDEVLTGFRAAYGGAGERFGVLPDLVCLGKA
ncbi:MAG: aminotransferase class III-fold pyridoxal phosphate-dependent enzyme, partial [Myxococcota bacterium]